MDTDPLSIILVRNGSKGDRLLFRYPFAGHNEGQGDRQGASRRRGNPYALITAEDSLMSSFQVQSNISQGKLTGFSDQDLSTLLAVKPELCGSKFELKVNDVRFVGHPTLLEGAGRSGGLTSFVVAFALRATASHAIVRLYHQLSQQLGIGLRHEERRCSYLSTEARIMISAYDEAAAREENNADGESPFANVRMSSGLAEALCRINDDLCSHGTVQLRLNRWVLISFCLPQKVHMAGTSGRLERPIEPENIQECLEALRPYHGLLLLEDEAQFLRNITPDSSPALVRLIRAHSPLKNLQALADDAGLALPHVFQLAGHLIYWARAMVIYPLCESNVYTLSPEAVAAHRPSSALSEEFSERFGHSTLCPYPSLVHVLADFSLPTRLGDRTMYGGAGGKRPQPVKELVQVIVWLLRHRLLIQLHTYVYLSPTSHGPLIPADSDGNGSLPPRAAPVDPVTSTPASPVSTDENLLAVLSHLGGGEEERAAILHVPAAANSEDLRLFTRLCRYFDGRHHLEEMMYYENVRRSHLLQLLDKFREVLITCDNEDVAVAKFYSPLS